MSGTTTPLGRTIRRLRLARGLKQRELAAHIGCCTAHVSRAETGRHEPTFGVLRRYAAAFGITCSQLFALVELEGGY